MSVWEMMSMVFIFSVIIGFLTIIAIEQDCEFAEKNLKEFMRRPQKNIFITLIIPIAAFMLYSGFILNMSKLVIIKGGSALADMIECWLISLIALAIASHYRMNDLAEIKTTYGAIKFILFIEPVCGLNRAIIYMMHAQTPAKIIITIAIASLTMCYITFPPLAAMIISGPGIGGTISFISGKIMLVFPKDLNFHNRFEEQLLLLIDNKCDFIQELNNNKLRPIEQLYYKYELPLSMITKEK